MTPLLVICLRNYGSLKRSQYLGPLSSCWLNNSSPRPLSTILRGPDTSSSCVTRNRHAKPPGVDMNLTLVAAVALLLLWGVLVFDGHNGSGPVQLLYAVSVVLFARRIIAGAPKFLS